MNTNEERITKIDTNDQKVKVVYTFLIKDSDKKTLVKLLNQIYFEELKEKTDYFDYGFESDKTYIKAYFYSEFNFSRKDYIGDSYRFKNYFEDVFLKYIFE